jgi:peptide/nickel transport system substrate-binding protein
MGGLFSRARPRRSRFTSLFGALSVALALTLAACGGSTSSGSGGGASTASGSTLRFTWIGDLYPVWHPAGYETFGQSVIFSLIFDNLVRVGPDEHTIVPDLADSWTVNPSDTVFTFHLHHGVKWQDGKPFTAADVAFTIEKSYSYKFLDTNQSWMAIKGAADYAAGKTSTLSGLQTPNPYTVVITLAAPGPDFLNQLSDSYNVILPEHILKSVPPASIQKTAFSTTDPVGTGPYKFVKYVTNSYVQFVANPDYFMGAPKIKQLFMVQYQSPDIAMSQLQAGSIQLALRLDPTDGARVKADSSLKEFSIKGAGQTTMMFNSNTIPEAVRQAAFYAINRAAIVKSVFQGQARVLDLPPGFVQNGSGVNPYSYNPAKAKALLKQAGWNPSKPFRIIYDQTYPLVQEYMPIIQQNLKAVGINATLLPMDSTTFIAKSTTASDYSTWEAAMENGGDEALEPANSSIYYDCKDNAQVGYKNCQVDSLFAKAAETADATQQASLYAQAGQILNTELPSLYLWSPNLLSAASTKLGGGFDVRENTKYTFFNVTKWTLAGSG